MEHLHVRGKHPTHRYSLSFINNGNIPTEKNAEILRPVSNTKRWKVLPSSGFYTNRNYKGGLKMHPVWL